MHGWRGQGREGAGGGVIRVLGGSTGSKGGGSMGS